jgi:hypothetical protein
METIQPLTQWVQEILDLEIKKLEHEAKHTSTATVELKMCETTLPLTHISACNSTKHQDKLTFTFMESVTHVTKLLHTNNNIGPSRKNSHLHLHNCEEQSLRFNRNNTKKVPIARKQSGLNRIEKTAEGAVKRSFYRLLVCKSSATTFILYHHRHQQQQHI